MAARGIRWLVFVLLFTSLFAFPPSLAAQSVRYEYDALGRLTVVSTPEGVAGASSAYPSLGKKVFSGVDPRSFGCRSVGSSFAVCG